ncbi:MAG: dephospho-CoA kinase [Desulfuromonadaceae bacterium]
MILGVTGGIASGKSTAAALLGELGAHVISADQVAREVVEPGSEVLAQLEQIFGGQIMTREQTLDRKRLGTIVFDDPGARAQLEAVMHPAIAELSRQRLAAAAQKYPLVVYEAPLLFEANAQERVDKVLCITVDPEIQLQRVQERDGCSETEAQARIDAQMPQRKKAELSDYIVDNSADLDALREQIENLWHTQLMRSGTE